VSRLILTDRSPALREALLDVLYVDGSFSPTRLRVLLDSSQGLVNEGDAFVDFDTLSDKSSITKEAVELLFSDDGLVLREILTDEIASGLDVLARSALGRATSSLETVLPTPIRSLVMRARGGTFGSPSLGVLPGGALAASLVATRDRLLPPVTQKERVQIENMRIVVDWLSEGGGDFGAVLRLAERLFQDVIRGDGETVAGRRRVSPSAVGSS
jgi:hypothetical protein